MAPATPTATGTARAAGLGPPRSWPARARGCGRRPSRSFGLDAGAPGGPDGRCVAGARRQVEPVTTAQGDIALVGMEHDRALEAEQHLVEAVVVAAVAVTGAIA